MQKLQQRLPLLTETVQSSCLLGSCNVSRSATTCSCNVGLKLPAYSCAKQREQEERAARLETLQDHVCIRGRSRVLHILHTIYCLHCFAYAVLHCFACIVLHILLFSQVGIY